MRFSRHVLIVIASVLLGSGVRAHAADQAQTPIVIAFHGTTVRANGITPGREAIVFACTVDRYSGFRRVARRADVIVDSDSDGAVDLSLTSLPVTSVWAVVDLESGRYALASPDGFSAPVYELPDNQWKHDDAFLEIQRDYLEILLVRPGSGPHAGAWTLTGSEGGSNDGDDNLNQKLRMTMARMKRLHGADSTPQPEKVQSKDVVIAIDPHDLDAFVKEAK